MLDAFADASAAAGVTCAGMSATVWVFSGVLEATAVVVLVLEIFFPTLTEDETGVEI